MVVVVVVVVVFSEVHFNFFGSPHMPTIEYNEIGTNEILCTEVLNELKGGEKCITPQMISDCSEDRIWSIRESKWECPEHEEIEFACIFVCTNDCFEQTIFLFVSCSFYGVATCSFFGGSSFFKIVWSTKDCYEQTTVLDERFFFCLLLLLWS
jgi:hypothetical protein